MGKWKEVRSMTEFDKKQMSTAMEDVAVLIEQYAATHKCSDVQAADILRYALLAEMYAALKSIDRTLDAML